MKKAKLYVGHEDGGCVDIGELVLADGYQIDKIKFDFTKTPSSDWSYRSGLPKVGDIIEYSCVHYESEGVKKGQWYRGAVIAYHGGAVWTSDNGIRQLDNTIFRPIKSQRERAIEEIHNVLHSCDSIATMAAELYEAGYRKEKK